MAKKSKKLTTFTRWAAWEKGVLSKVGNPALAQRTILKRQAAVDDDASEVALVREYIEAKLRAANQNPVRCCVAFSIPLLAEWLTEATGNNIARAKVANYLTAWSLPELSPRRTERARLWVWRGPECKKKVPPSSFDTLRCIPK